MTWPQKSHFSPFGSLYLKTVRDRKKLAATILTDKNNPIKIGWKKLFMRLQKSCFWSLLTPFSVDFQKCYSCFFSISCRLLGSQKAKNMIFEATWNFYFHPILMDFFHWIPHWDLSELLHSILSVSYRFRDTRGQNG